MSLSMMLTDVDRLASFADRSARPPFAADYCFESASMYLSGLASNATSCSFMQK
jgi:hypothetical protein